MIRMELIMELLVLQEKEVGIGTLFLKLLKLYNFYDNSFLNKMMILWVK